MIFIVDQSSFLSPNYMKQVYSRLPCICSVISHRRRQNVVRTSVTHLAIASCATFLFLSHFNYISDLLLNRHKVTLNLILLHKFLSLVLKCSMLRNQPHQEPITRGIQLPHISVTAFSQTDLFLV